ncbi:UbiA family prenyltransferase [Streptomyces sp. DSM 40712]|uniref:UbiA family prenyltransferase n=1 Tax=Streptomyces lancefieldiae TaxID=3075520 RepID=A0ABU3AUC9_9ACTN|nr:UbiA family prenyltransferase [Streptomyces sp. DSM 40712]MDT0612703.1 UbiA family prenyltransferase [Streptomyces sp. DSM 40712]
MLRLPAVLTVPGDVLAGTAAAGARPGRATALAVGASICLYEAGMALNDWADLDEDAVARPHRPLPSGRVRPRAALTAAGALTATGLALAACAGRRTLAVAAPLAATVWAYDLKLKHTAAGPAAMAAARGLDLLLGAAAADRPLRPALVPAATLAGHTCAVTLVSRRETEGGSPAAPLTALAATAALTASLLSAPHHPAADHPAPHHPAADRPTAHHPTPHHHAVRTALALGYLTTAAGPLVHAALHPSPALVQRAVGAGIRATVCLQGALAARAGAPATGLLTAALAPAAARLARKVSTT